MNCDLCNTNDSYNEALSYGANGTFPYKTTGIGKTMLVVIN